MFEIITISHLARETIRERTRKSEWLEYEGVRVQVPNIIDRALAILRAVLVNRTSTGRQVSASYAPRERLAI